MRNKTWVATLLDGSQIMVEYWADDDSVTVATRTDKWERWEPRTPAEDQSWNSAS